VIATWGFTSIKLNFIWCQINFRLLLIVRLFRNFCESKSQLHLLLYELIDLIGLSLVQTVLHRKQINHSCVQTRCHQQFLIILTQKLNLLFWKLLKNLRFYYFWFYIIILKWRCRLFRFKYLLNWLHFLLFIFDSEESPARPPFNPITFQ
jgi:hypothetical protein